jgi:Sporulation and spore germination
MIPRYQRILFWVLAAAILLMALVLLRGCEQAREKLTRHRDETPLAAPVATASESVRLAVANDSDGTITLVERQIALPSEATARIRALLARLIAEYSYKGSAHPIESGPAIDDVFLLDLPLRPAAAAAGTNSAGDRNSASTSDTSAPTPATDGNQPQAPGGQLAVINLHGDFANRHPSGIESETLTIDSILGTLYANFPRIEQVRFLVDGQPRETLNGHADLLRTYTVLDTSTKSASTAPREGQPQ